jgi:hypothetical protein
MEMNMIQPGVGFQGFICEATGEKVVAETCLSCAFKGALPGCDYTATLIETMLHSLRDPGFSRTIAEEKYGKAVDIAASATELESCPRKLQLRQRVEWYAKPSELFWTLRGNAAHSRLEHTLMGVPELRLHLFFPFYGKTVGISGQPDLITYRPDLGGLHIVDYKTTKEIRDKLFEVYCPETGEQVYQTPYKPRSNVNCTVCGQKHAASDCTIIEVEMKPRGGHAFQVNIYRLLVDRNRGMVSNALRELLGDPVTEIDLQNAPVVGAEIVYMDMARAKRIPVELWDNANLMEQLKAALERHDTGGELAPVIDPLASENRSRLWECDYCDVREACEQLHGSKVGKAGLKAAQAA